MGVDLRLLPVECEAEHISFSSTVLECDRSPSLFDVIRKLPQGQIRENFRSFSGRNDNYRDLCYGKTSQNAYGEPLTWTHAFELVLIITHPGVYESQQNRAVWAYLAELPPDTKVALYWH